MKKLCIYDTSLREGMQGAGTSFTLDDKLRILQYLDEMHVDYAEIGNPAYNPKDFTLCQRLSELGLKHVRPVVFGSTCRKGCLPQDDRPLNALIEAGTDSVCIFGKSSLFHVTEILRALPEENLDMIRNSVSYLKAHGKEVIFDAEHFFDGYKADPDYALASLSAAADGGADWICLCDTNGGTMPYEISDITNRILSQINIKLGIHCHNDSGMANANSIMAINAGVDMLQLTLHGWGERCGNADFFTLIPNLQLKLDFNCMPDNVLASLTRISREIAALTNIRRNPHAPFVGRSAFSHKAGTHIDAVSKNPASFEHINPALVGNERHLLLSEVSGRSAVIQKASKLVPSLEKDSALAEKLLTKLKELEFRGYLFEGADASFELLVLKVAGLYKPFFDLKSFKVIVCEPSSDGTIASAVIKINVEGTEEITAAEGNGPVNALDIAARKALEHFYPELCEMKLTDYKVRVLDSGNATDSMVRVLIESSDSSDKWTTVGCSTDIIDASWTALVDSLEYKLYKERFKTQL